MRTSISFQHIAALRLQGQQLAQAAFTTPAALLTWMGAIQAQEFPMALWAIGLRLPGSTVGEVTAAFNNGEILRTHVLRPTWHFVAKDNLPWMLELTAPHVRKSMTSNEKKLELTAAIFKKSNKIIRSLLGDAAALTREEVIQAWEKAGIRTGEYRSGHLLAHAELDGIVCSGPLVNGKQTYALLSNRVREQKKYDRETALKTLAGTYFQSRGPATLADFSWWSGLPVSTAREAIEMQGSQLEVFSWEGNEYWLMPQETLAVLQPRFHLLPAFDELFVAYKDRDVYLRHKAVPKDFSTNGMLRPALLHRGQVRGLWKRSAIKGSLSVAASFYGNATGAETKQIHSAGKTFAEFLELPLRSLDIVSS